MMLKGKTLLDIRCMSKNFGVTIALDNVSFSISYGEIRGLIGENGSGKSTIASIIAGIQPATTGEAFLRGEPWKPTTQLEAIAGGVGMIVQETGTIEDISVAENIFLGRYEPFKRGPVINRSKMNAEAQKVLDLIGVNFRASQPTHTLDMQQRKLLELAKVMYHKPDLLIIDETSTALAQDGRAILYRMMHQQVEKGKSVLLISHDLEEMMEHCDTLTILRDGHVIDNIPKEKYEPGDIKSKLVGREMQGSYYRTDHDGCSNDAALVADCITTIEDILCLSFRLYKGEILGIGGLSDCGMHTLGRALYGIDEVVDGEVRLPGKGNKVINNTMKAKSNGMGYVSKDRDTESLELNASVYANISSTGYQENRGIGPFISAKKELGYVMEQIENLLIKCVGPHQPTRFLSGGNKQKVVFGKWVAANSDILILDCPTRGVDIGVKASMYQLIYKMKQEGKSIIMISEELPELIGMSDRLLIMKDGKISGEFLRKDGFNEHELINYMI